MAFASGKFVLCASPACDSTQLTTTRESWDEQDQIFVGEQQCDVCQALMLYSRRPENPQEKAMAKKQTRARPTPQPSTAKRKKLSAHRVNTHKPNGAAPESQAVAPEPERVSIGEAMRRAVEQLGEVIVDTQLAPQQLRELGAAYEEIAKRQAAYDAKADEAKTAKKSLESAQEFLLGRVRDFTHPVPLPLFDKVEREGDQADMLQHAKGAEA